MSHKHRVRSHHWRQGRLIARDIIFGDLESALDFVKSLECDSYKIFDESDLVVASGGGSSGPSYA